MVPVHNCEPYLDEAFDSVLKQTFLIEEGGDLEVSVYDDASTVRQWMIYARSFALRCELCDFSCFLLRLLTPLFCVRLSCDSALTTFF